MEKKYFFWPAISSRNLFEGCNILMTLDARDVYSEVVKTVFDLDDEDKARHFYRSRTEKKSLSLIR